MARCLTPMTAAKKRVTSSRLRTTGSLLGCLGQGDAYQDSLPTEGDLVEEPQRGDGLVVDAPGDLLLLDEVEQVGTDVVAAQGLGGPPEVAGEVGDARDVDSIVLGARLRSFMSSIIRGAAVSSGGVTVSS